MCQLSSGKNQMKIKYYLLLLSISSLNAMQTIPDEISPYDKEKDLESVVEMMLKNDDENTLTPLTSSLEEKKQLLTRFFKNESQNSFVIKENDQIVGFLSTTKRKAPSHELVEELKTKGNDYQNMVELLLARPNLPQKSNGFCIRGGIIITKSHRRKGLAKKLITYALQNTPNDPDVTTIEIDVKKSNTAIIPLCESLGFDKVDQAEELEGMSLSIPIQKLKLNIAELGNQN